MEFMQESLQNVDLHSGKKALTPHKNIVKACYIFLEFGALTKFLD